MSISVSDLPLAAPVAGADAGWANERSIEPKSSENAAKMAAAKIAIRREPKKST